MDKYLLGLLASDGFTQVYIKQNGEKSYYSKLEMSEKQLIEDICNKYNKILHYRQRIIKNKVREFWAVSFSSFEMDEYGQYLIKGRPCIKEMYNSFSEKDKIEFIRGVFDGDGSIVFKYDPQNVTSTDRFRKTIGFSVNGQQSEMKEIIIDFAKTHNLTVSVYFDKRGSGSWYLSFNGEKSLEHIYHLFFDSQPTLKNLRKYNTFNDFYNTCCSSCYNNLKEIGGSA